MSRTEAALPAPDVGAGAARSWDVARGVAGIDALAAEWSELVPRDELPTATPWYTRAFWSAFGPRNAALELHALRLDGRLAAVLPVQRSGHLTRTLASLANVRHMPACAPALDARSAEAPGAALEHMLARADVFELGLVHASGAAVTALLEAARARRLHVERVGFGGDTFLRLPDDWATFHRSLSANLRRATERKTRQLRSRGRLACERVTGGRELEALVRECFELEALGWKGERGDAVVRRPGWLQFYVELARAAADAGVFALYTLRLDDRLIAFEYRMRAGRRLYLLKLSFDPAFARFSPGNALRLQILQREIEEHSAASYHFGQPVEWKLRWTSEVEPLIGLRFYARRPRATLAWVGAAAPRRALRQARALMRAPVEDTPSVEAIALDSRAFRELAGYDGRLFREWVAAWERLRVPERDAFTHPVWIVSWLRSFGGAEASRYRLLLFRDGARLLGALPVEQRIEPGPFGDRCWYAHPENQPIGGAGAAFSSADFERVLAAALSSGAFAGPAPLMLRLGRVDEGNALLSVAFEHLPRIVLPSGLRYVIDLDDGYDALWSRISRKERKNLRQSYNHLCRLPEVRIDEITAPEEIAAAFDELVAIEARGWKAQRGERDEEKKAAGRSMARISELRDYFGSAAQQLARFGDVVVHVLRTQERAIGALFSFRANDTLYLARIAYDEEYAKAAPGQNLLGHALESYCARHGLTRANCIGNPAWVERWAPRAVPVYEVRVFPPGLRGLYGRFALLSWSERLEIVLVHLGLRETMLGALERSRLLRRLRDALRRRRVQRWRPADVRRPPE